MAVVVELNKYRTKKLIDAEVARGRNPLFVSHLKGKVTGSPYLQPPAETGFGDRLVRIRQSLEKINRLMQELKECSDVPSKYNKA